MFSANPKVSCTTFSFSVFHFLVVGSVRPIKLTYVGFRAHAIGQHLVSYYSRNVDVGVSRACDASFSRPVPERATERLLSAAGLREWRTTTRRNSSQQHHQLLRLSVVISSLIVASGSSGLPRETDGTGRRALLLLMLPSRVYIAEGFIARPVTTRDGELK